MMTLNELSVRHCLCFVFVFCIFIERVTYSDGFRWIYQPQPQTSGEIGSNYTIRWHYNMSDVETFRNSHVKTNGKNIAVRQFGENKYFFERGFNKSDYQVVGKTNVTLFMLPRLETKHDGQYCCRVQYRDSKTVLHDSISCTTLTTYALPSIDTTNISTVVTANVSDVVSLYCKASGKPLPRIQWTKTSDPNNTVLSRDNTFHLNKTVKAQAGEYECKATNQHGETTARFVVHIQYKPSIDKLVQTVDVNEGDNVTLSCKATSQPAPDIYWFYNGSSIGNGQTKFLTSIQRQHAGNYSCSASNMMGRDQHFVYVNVQYGPQFSHFNRLEIVKEYANISLHCSATGNPAPNVTWYRHGTALTTGHKQATLKLLKIDRSRGGEYVCKASNKLGVKTSLATLVVHFQPKITASPGNATVSEGQDLTLNCTAEGMPKPMISWSRDDDTIISNSSIFHVTNVSRSQSGRYRCTANNTLGHAISWTTFNVQYKPDIVFITNTQTVNETSSVTLYCNATGNPTPYLQWFNGSKPVSSTSENSVTWVVANISKLNRGDYQCIANNTIGTASLQTSLIVQYAPTIVSGVADLNVTEGDQITLTCQATGYPTPSIRWTYTGLLQPQHSNNITVNVSRSNDGQVSCTARNLLGQDEKTAMLNVFYPPVILEKSNNVTLNETGDIVLRCNASGKPLPVITWTKDSSAVVIHTGPVYSKINATVDDAGLYRCTADNGVGRPLSAQASVVVHFKPVVTATTQQLYSWIGRPIRLVCLVQGVPRPTITWSRPGRELRQLFNSTTQFSILVFTPNTSIDFGVYTCWAQNFMGKDNDSFVITEVVRPGSPQILNIETTKDSVEIHWSPPTSDDGSSIQGYLVQIRKKEGQQKWQNCTDIRKAGDNWSCSLGDLDSNTQYVVKIYANNEVGLGEPVEKDFKTKPAETGTGLNTGNKTKKVTNNYVLMGVGIGAGVLILIIMIVVIVRKQKQFQREDLPMELNPAVVTDLSNAHDGPALSASNQSIGTQKTSNQHDTSRGDTAL